MDKYDWYFFSDPWPQKYDYKQATSFTQTDLAFLLGTKEAPVDAFEAADRSDTVCLKKNISMKGFQRFLWNLLGMAGFQEIDTKN